MEIVQGALAVTQASVVHLQVSCQALKRSSVTGQRVGTASTRAIPSGRPSTAIIWHCSLPGGSLGGRVTSASLEICGACMPCVASHAVQPACNCRPWYLHAVPGHLPTCSFARALWLMWRPSWHSSQRLTCQVVARRACPCPSALPWCQWGPRCCPTQAQSRCADVRAAPQ